jgi:DNA-binding response OmpR family regulator
MATRILAVDNEPDILRLIEIKLSKAGFEVLVAGDGEEGLRLALTEKPALTLDNPFPRRTPRRDAIRRQRARTRLHLQFHFAARGLTERTAGRPAGGLEHHAAEEYAASVACR